MTGNATAQASGSGRCIPCHFFPTTNGTYRHAVSVSIQCKGRGTALNIAQGILFLDDLIILFRRSENRQIICYIFVLLGEIANSRNGDPCIFTDLVQIQLSAGRQLNSCTGDHRISGNLQCDTRTNINTAIDGTAQDLQRTGTCIDVSAQGRISALDHTVMEHERTTIKSDITTVFSGFTVHDRTAVHIHFRTVSADIDRTGVGRKLRALFTHGQRSAVNIQLTAVAHHHTAAAMHRAGGCGVRAYQLTSTLGVQNGKLIIDQEAASVTVERVALQVNDHIVALIIVLCAHSTLAECQIGAQEIVLIRCCHLAHIGLPRNLLIAVVAIAHIALNPIGRITLHDPNMGDLSGELVPECLDIVTIFQCGFFASMLGKISTDIINLTVLCKLPILRIYRLFVGCCCRIIETCKSGFLNIFYIAIVAALGGVLYNRGCYIRIGNDTFAVYLQTNDRCYLLINKGRHSLVFGFNCNLLTLTSHQESIVAVLIRHTGRLLLFRVILAQEVVVYLSVLRRTGYQENKLDLILHIPKRSYDIPQLEGSLTAYNSAVLIDIGIVDLASGADDAVPDVSC